MAIIYNNKLKIGLIVLFFLLVFSISALAGGPGAEYKLVAENKFNALFVNEETTEIAVENKQNSTFWYTNPVDLDRREQIARGSAKDRLRAQFSINFYGPGDRRRSMDNYNDSVVYDQFEINLIDDGVRIDYILGEEWGSRDHIPVMIGEDHFQEAVLAKLEDRDKSFILDSYVPMSLEEIDEDYQRKNVYLVDKEEIFADYRLVSSDESYQTEELVEFLIDQVVNNNRSIAGREEVTSAHVSYLLNQLKENQVFVLRDNLRMWDWDDLIEIFNKINFKPDEVTRAHFEHSIDPPIRNIRVFEIPLEYYLDGQDLIVRVPVEEIIYPVNVFDYDEDSYVNFPIHDIRLLPFFGAADMEEEGYIFVPDGSGALINFNNNRTYAPPFSGRVYGRDNALIPRQEKINYTEQTYLPVFGLKHVDKAFLAIIEEGDALAEIRADIAGKANSFNIANSSYTLINFEEINLTGDYEDRSINVYQPEIYQGDIKIRYSFLDGEQANYTEMALLYQDYLVEKRALSRLEKEEKAPFYLETIAAIFKRQPVFGLPRDVVEPLTTFSETKKITERLMTAGVENLNLKYTGWLEGGLEHRFPARVNIESKLGSKSDFLAMITFLEQNEIKFYPEAAFLNIYQDNLFDGFSARRFASRHLDRTYAKFYPYDIATYQSEENRPIHVLSPGQLDNVFSGFLESFQEFNTGSLALRYMGKQLNSDYRRDKEKFIDRTEAKALIEAQAGRLSNNNQFDIMVNGANSYMLPYVNTILNLPGESSQFNIIDSSVPFYQIVLSGYFNFADRPLNMADDYHKQKLKMLETGSRPFFKLYYRQPEVVKDSAFEYLYSSSIDNWYEEIVELNQKHSDFFNSVYGERIIDHKQLAEGVYQTTFENGVIIIVNYNKNDITVNNEISIPAMGYKIREGN